MPRDNLFVYQLRMWRPRTLLVTVLVGLAAAHWGLALPPNGKKWALLVAGSKEFYNYRHQVRAAQN